MIECSSEIPEGAGHIILMAVCWDSKVMRKERNSGGGAFPSGAWNKKVIIPVVIRAASDVPSLHAMLGPGAALCWSFIDLGC